MHNVSLLTTIKPQQTQAGKRTREVPGAARGPRERAALVELKVLCDLCLLDGRAALGLLLALFVQHSKQ